MANFDPNFERIPYWIERGKEYIKEPRLQDPQFRFQEQFIVKAVKSLAPTEILELGCGYGRITREIGLAMPTTMITGFDISPDQIDNARMYCCDLPNTFFQQSDVSKIEHWGNRDMCLAVEFFLHLPPEEFEAIIPRLIKSNKVIVHTFDPDPIIPRGQHVFLHEYEAYYASLDLKVEVYEYERQQPGETVTSLIVAHVK